MKKATEKQAEPTPGKQQVIDFVLQDLKARSEMGTLKYGTPLMTFNGRDALWGAYQEAPDLAMYLRQAICEGNEEEKTCRHIMTSEMESQG